MKTPLISLIIPVYNVENYLDSCLASATKQSYKNLEIILVNDGSTDNSSKICEKWAKKDSRFILIKQKNQGLSAARNTGIKKAHGEYIAFLDSDDELPPDYIKSLHDAIKDADIAIAPFYLQSSKGKTQQGNSNEGEISPKDAIETLLLSKGIEPNAFAKLYKRELFTDINFPEGKLYEDTGTTLKLFTKASKITQTNSPNYFYKIRQNSITKSAWSPQKYDLITNLEDAQKTVLKKFPDLEDDFNIRIFHAHISLLKILATSTTSTASDTTKNNTDERKKLIQNTRKSYQKIQNRQNIPKNLRLSYAALEISWPLFKSICKLYDRKNQA